MTATPPEPPEPPLVNPFDDPALETSELWEDSVKRLSEPGPTQTQGKRSPATDRFSRPTTPPTGAMERMYNYVQESMDSLKPLLNKMSSALGGLRPLRQKVGRWWQQTLPKIRRVLPRAVNQAVPDALLTGVAIALSVILLWGISNLLLGGKPAQVRQVPPAEPAVVSASPVEASSLDIDPDPQKIAEIQDQVAEISEQYATGLIQSVQANFRDSRLTVMVGDRWYTLSAARQDSLANELLGRAQKLNFSKLEMTDGNNDLLARSPVIGEAMIVLKRQLENAPA